MRSGIRCLLWCLVPLLGCGRESRSLDDDLRPRLAAEIPGKVELFAGHVLDDPAMTLASYAVGDDGKCNGAFIGPNLYLGAAHCDIDEPRVSKTVYPDQDVATADWMYVDCQMLLQHEETLPSDPVGHSDIQLNYCPDIVVNGQVVAPGDYFGYLDLDLRHFEAADDHGVYSLFYLPFNGLWHWPVLWAPGTDLSKQAPDPADLRLWADVWGEPGVEGSAVLSADAHRWAVAPTANVGGPGHGSQMSMADAAALGQVAPNSATSSPQIIDARVLALGLNPAAYEGPLDGDGDGIFDLQNDLERIRGEKRRDVFHFGFESRRKNALWTLGQWGHLAETISPTAGPQGHIEYFSYNGTELIASHTELNLRPSTTYAISIRAHVTYAAHIQDNILVAINDNSGAPTPHEWVDLQPYGVTTTNLVLTTGPWPGELALFTNGGFDAEIDEIVVRRAERAIDLDMHDERRLWRDLGTGGPAMVTAGDDAADLEWELWLDDQHIARSDLLGFIDGEAYRVCFDVEEGAGSTDPQHLQVAVFDAGGYVDSDVIAVTPGTTTHCFEFVAGMATELEFSRVTGGVPGGVTVDDIAIGCTECPCLLCSPGTPCSNGMCQAPPDAVDDGGDSSGGDWSTMGGDTAEWGGDDGSAGGSGDWGSG